MNAESRSPEADQLQRSTINVQRSTFPLPAPGEFALPGTIVAYSPPSSGIFLGSPSLLRCADGSLLVSHDQYRPGAHEDQVGRTFLYRSRDEGCTWIPLGEIRRLTVPGPEETGVFWNSFFRAGARGQYPFFLIEGDDLLATIRTAFTDAEGGTRAGHDANYYLFRRMADFRQKPSTP